MANLLSPDQRTTPLPLPSTTPSLNSLTEKEVDNNASNSRNSIEYPPGHVFDEEKIEPEQSSHLSQRNDLPQEAERIYTRFRWVIVCVALYVNAFLYGLDQTIVADVQGSVIERFGEVNKLGWIGIGFSMGSVAVILPFGKAFSLFNIKWLFIASIVMFEGGSALCGAAPSMDALIFGRVWAGAGGAGMYLG
jgi:hypothetical protein